MTWGHFVLVMVTEEDGHSSKVCKRFISGVVWVVFFLTNNVVLQIRDASVITKLRTQLDWTFLERKERMKDGWPIVCLRERFYFICEGRKVVKHRCKMISAVIFKCPNIKNIAFFIFTSLPFIHIINNQMLFMVNCFTLSKLFPTVFKLI